MRPRPPADLVDPLGTFGFEPAPDVEAWMRQTFIDEGAILENPDHAHLRGATIGVLWTNVPLKRHMRQIIGQAELVTVTAATWSKARGEMQVRNWFGGEAPDFLITLSAPHADEMEDVEFMALVEHEATHCAQARDAYGAPKFNTQTGAPIFAMKAHDISEFVGVVERYGSTSPELTAAVRAVNAGPTISLRQVSISCGTCLRAVA